MLQLPLDFQLDDAARFDNFYAGENLQLVEQLGSLNSNSNFIYVWGNVESGKTHLAQAVCHLCDDNDLSAVYLPLSNPSFKPDILVGMNHVDLVCIDDLEAIALGQSQLDWEKALFDLYNQLKSENKRLVIFSKNNPQQLTFQLADFESRLNAMEIYKLSQLNDQQKSDFLIKRAAIRGIDLSTEVAQFILMRKSRTMCDLVQSLEEIDRSSFILKRKVTIPLIKQIFDI